MTLKQKIFETLDHSLPHHSRVHLLHGYIPPSDSAPVYIKREDELSPAAIGSKLRKYLSLLPEIEFHGYQEVILVGSAYSNNLIGLAQFLLSRAVEVHVFIKDPGDRQPSGNLLFLKMLLPEWSIHALPGPDWPDVIQHAEAFAQSRRAVGKKILVVPEGGDCRAVIPGLLTLAVDIEADQNTLGFEFTDIWTDSGTGISAIGLLLGMRLLGMTMPHVHITLIAGNEQEFAERYQRFERWTSEWLGTEIPRESPKVSLTKSATAAAFGSINKTIQTETLRIARETGILMDPVYSVKHLFTVKQALANLSPAGPQLVLYNGGPLGLCGFQQMFAGLLNTK
ncbi:MAG: hypothetical protein C0631_08795 [Sedimenticola sp.]|nr:MAG: hypothetical protein C0631_08795 [Sedimenticola sp.]